MPPFRLIQRRVDPLDSRLDLTPVAGAPGAFEYLATLPTLGRECRFTDGNQT